MMKSFGLVALVLGGGVFASDVPANPNPEIIAIYQQVLSDFCERSSISKEISADKIHEKISKHCLDRATLNAIVALYPPKDDDQKRLFFYCVFNSNVDVFKYALSSFDRIFGAVPSRFFSGYINVKPEWFNDYYQKEPILKEWLEARKTPEDRRREEEERQAEERREREAKAQKEREEQEKQQKLLKMYGLSNANSPAVSSLVDVTIRSVTQKNQYGSGYGTVNDFQALWTIFSNQHSGGWSEVEPPIKETYGSSSFWVKPNVLIRLSIDQTYDSGKKGRAVGMLVAVAALRHTQDGTETVSEGYGAGHMSYYQKARYVRKGQTTIEDVKSLIGAFALRNSSNSLELSVSSPNGSWQKVEIKNPGYDAPDGLIFWLQVGEALSFN